MIKLKNLNFTYENSTQGIYDVNLEVKENECIALIGKSGNGKTTLTRVLNGLAPTHYKGDLSGDIYIDGKNVTDTKLWELSKTVGSVFQDPKAQFFSSELNGEIAFSLENFGFSMDEIKKRTDKIVSENKLEYLKETSLDKLSSGEKQKVAISSVLALSPKILVFDEPSANLDETSANKLGEMMAELKSKGHTIIIAEHRISYISSFVDRYIYIKDGRIYKEFTFQELKNLSKHEKDEMGLRSVTKVERKNLSQFECSKNSKLIVENLDFKIKKKSIIQNLTFSIPSSCTVAIIGENGTCKTTLATLLCGLNKPTNGSIKINSNKIKSQNLYKYVWYSSNDTNTQFFTSSLTDELLLLTEKTESNLEKAKNILKEIELYNYKDRHPQTLSGGQKQRLSIACGVLSNREILIFDEPTSGLDGKNLKIVAKLFETLKNQGKTVLIITHDNELINACCDYEINIKGAKYG